MKLLRRHSFLSLLVAYVASIYLWSQLVLFRARWNHEAVWKKPAARTYPISDRISSDAHKWFMDQTTEDARDVAEVDYATAVEEDRAVGTDPILCVAIDTFARHGPNYLPATLGALLQPLNSADRSRIHVIVRFKGDIDDDGKEQHPSYDALASSHLVDQTASGFRGQPLTQINPAGLNTTPHDIWQWRYQQATTLAAGPGRANAQGVVDYAHALSLCLDSGTPYILVLEDDIVAQPRWLDRIHTQVIPELEQMSARGAQHSYTYLGYTSQFRGWQNKDGPRIAVALVSLYLVAVVVLWKTRLVTAVHLYHGTDGQETALFTWLERNDGTASHTLSNLPTNPFPIRLLVLLLFPLLLTPYVVLFFAQGKEAALPLPFGVSPAEDACCSFALLFSRKSAAYFSRHLSEDGYADERMPTPRDAALHEIAKESAGTEYIYKPPLFQHVGVVSDKGFANLHRGRNMAFELDILD